MPLNERLPLPRKDGCQHEKLSHSEPSVKAPRHLHFLPWQMPGAPLGGRGWRPASQAVSASQAVATWPRPGLKMAVGDLETSHPAAASRRALHHDASCLYQQPSRHHDASRLYQHHDASRLYQQPSRAFWLQPPGRAFEALSTETSVDKHPLIPPQAKVIFQRVQIAVRCEPTNSCTVQKASWSGRCSHTAKDNLKKVPWWSKSRKNENHGAARSRKQEP